MAMMLLNVSRRSAFPKGVFSQWMYTAGCGFIQGADGKEYFVPPTVWKDQQNGTKCVKPGDQVQFDLKPDDRNPGKFIAANVQGGSSDLGFPEQKKLYSKWLSAFKLDASTPPPSQLAACTWVEQMRSKKASA